MGLRKRKTGEKMEEGGGGLTDERHGPVRGPQKSRG